MEIIPNWHPIFVHFTVALLSVSILLYIAGVLLKSEDIKTQLLVVARWNLWLGAGFTVLTVITGWYAYNTVAHDDPSHLAMTDHRDWAIVTAVTFFAITSWSIWSFVKGKMISTPVLIIMCAALILLGSTAWRGGELVYRYGLGVMSLPVVAENAADGHQHDHGELHLNAVESQVEKKTVIESSSHEGHQHSH